MKKEDPDREATVSFLGLLHYRLPPIIFLFPYSGEKEKKRNLSLSPDATTETFDSIFDSSDERIVDSNLCCSASRKGCARVVEIVVCFQSGPNIAGTRRLNERQRTRGILVKIDIIATGVTGCVSRRGAARVDIDTGNTPLTGLVVRR